MLVQIALQRKRLVAPFAVEVFESRMGLHVSSKVGPKKMDGKCNM